MRSRNPCETNSKYPQSGVTIEIIWEVSVTKEKAKSSASKYCYKSSVIDLSEYAHHVKNKLFPTSLVKLQTYCSISVDCSIFKESPMRKIFKE